jgi:hypothetical protein
MRKILAAAALATAFAVVPGAADACNIKGEWCGYPLWAANAFSHPRDRVNPNSGPILPSHSYEYVYQRRQAARAHAHGHRAGYKRRYRSRY